MNLSSRIENIQSWQQDSGFYPEVEVLLSIKSFDLQAIRKRYLASRENKSGKGGSVERRAVSLGGLAQMRLSSGKAELKSLVTDLKEPRGLSSAGDRLAFSLENRVIVLDEKGVHSFSDPWFSYIHTVAFHPQDKERILVSSSGFDALFEYNYPKVQKTWEWFAWEHGMNEAHGSDGQTVYLTRDEEQAKKWKTQGLPTIHIADPLKDHLPTAQRAAFINTSSYHSDGNILATLFHEGSVRKIMRASGESKIVLKGLKNPHGGFLIGDETILATNTGMGQLWINTKDDLRMYSGEGLPFKAPEMGKAEWWQNAIAWGRLFIVIDSNRNSLLILDPQNQKFDQLRFDANWAVQDLVVLKGSEPEFETALKQFQSKP